MTSPTDPTASKPTLQAEDIEWREATIVGDIDCPTCSRLMAIAMIPAMASTGLIFIPWAFCPDCRTYYQGFPKPTSLLVPTLPLQSLRLVK